jgi:hypothetical protein
MATNSISVSFWAARKTILPIRPNPLIATFTIFSPQKQSLSGADQLFV